MDFKLARYEFDLIPDEDINLPGYAGSTLRGGFGRAFRNVVCASRERECSECLLRANCVFPRIFDTVPPQGWDMMPNQTNAPRPFVIEPPVNGKQVYKPGEVITFGLILVGYVEEYLPYFIYSFEELGRRFGLGRGRGRFHLEEVRSVSLSGSAGIYSGNERMLKGDGHTIDMKAIHEHLKGSLDSVALHFITPTTIIRQDELTTGRDFDFEIFMRAVFRRASMLASLFCNSEWDLDYSSLLDKARGIKACSISHGMRRWERYSARQDRRISMRGFTGKFGLKGDLEEFLPFIKLGELIHVGKGTTFGMGKYVSE